MSSYYYDESLLLFHGSLTNVMGTRFDILITNEGRDVAEATWHSIVSELNSLSLMLNRFDSTSETSLINNTAFENLVVVSSEMWQILQSCKHYNNLTLGLFDITLKDFSKIVFVDDNQSIAFTHPDISIDFGGFAKGYALNKVKMILNENNIEHCFVNFGDSSILGVGHHPYGDGWKVSIDNPFNLNQVLDQITLKNQALSVSGNTPHYGAHIVRPDSGCRMVDPKLVCVISDNPLDVEVFSTALIIAEPNERNEIVKNVSDIKVLEFNL